MNVRLKGIDHYGPLIDQTVHVLPVTIGRGRDADVQIIDQFVSRVHCELTLTGDSVWVRDLSSGNGTFVNGRKSTESVLNPGDRVSVGITTFEVHYSKRAAARSADRMTELV